MVSLGILGCIMNERNYWIFIIYKCSANKQSSFQIAHSLRKLMLQRQMLQTLYQGCSQEMFSIEDGRLYVEQRFIQTHCSTSRLSCDYSSHFRGRDQMNKHKASKTILLLCTTTTAQFHIWCEIIIFFCKLFLRLSQVKVRFWGHFHIVGVCFPPDTHGVNVTIYRRFWTRTKNTRRKYFTLWYSTFCGKLLTGFFAHKSIFHPQRWGILWTSELNDKEISCRDKQQQGKYGY